MKAKIIDGDVGFGLKIEAEDDNERLLIMTLSEHAKAVGNVMHLCSWSLGGSRGAEAIPGVHKVQLEMRKPLGHARSVRTRSLYAWAISAFGHVEASGVLQRALRFFEEAIELFQACGGDRFAARKMIDYVFDRKAGDAFQELGGVGVTVLLLANALNLSADDCEEAETQRVLSKPIEEFTKRNRLKNDAGFRAVCDGDHAEPPCIDPQCWRKDPPR